MRQFAQSLVALGLSQSRHEVALIDGQRAIQAFAFTLVVAKIALRPRDVHPQRRLPGISVRRPAEEAHGCGRISCRQGKHPARVKRMGIAGFQLQRCFKLFPLFFAIAALTRSRRRRHQPRHVLFLSFHWPPRPPTSRYGNDIATDTGVNGSEETRKQRQRRLCN
ncbi:hypothetical protein [Sphingomonas sp. DBB INV C78]|uniref:hypothetical protein n=1 Tax=Sphingomonas sp. DBB INV C78 TaxID=3349434 RepID=UPI0036D40784